MKYIELSGHVIGKNVLISRSTSYKPQDVASHNKNIPNTTQNLFKNEEFPVNCTQGRRQSIITEKMADLRLSV
jgi:hypothetical protein